MIASAASFSRKPPAPPKHDRSLADVCQELALKIPKQAAAFKVLMEMALEQHNASSS